MTPRRDHLAMLLPVSRISMAEVTWEEFAAHIEHFAYAEAYRLGGTSDVAQLELVRWATLLYDPFEDTDPFLQAPWFGHPPDRVVIGGFCLNTHRDRNHSNGIALPDFWSHATPHSRQDQKSLRRCVSDLYHRSCAGVYFDFPARMLY